MWRHLRRAVRRSGFDVIRYDPRSHPLARRAKILESRGIELVLDVGANTGEYALQLREIGYAGRIVSFEPLPEEFALLADRAGADAQWEVRDYALGREADQRPINVAGNSFSSSFLSMLPRHEETAPSSRFIGTRLVQIRPLDGVLPHLVNAETEIWLKIDAQGFESQILDGAAGTLPRISVIQLESSLVPLYRGELLFPEMYKRLKGAGFDLVSIEPGLTDKRSGALLQIDAVFCRGPAPSRRT